MGTVKGLNQINNYLCRKQNMIFLFPAGFFLGCMFGLFCFEAIQEKEWISCWLAFISSISISTWDFFCYVVWKRLKQLIFVLIICFMPERTIIYVLWLMIECIIWGITVGCFSSCNGVAGFFIAMFSVFPHYLFYGIAAYLAYDLLILGGNRRIHNDLNSQYGRRNYIVVKGVRFHVFPFVIIVAIIGLLAECYVNPFVLKFFVNILIK